MPTVLLLDRSLSMLRSASADENSPSRLELARKGLTWFLDYLAQYFPLEYTTLLTFSSNCDIEPFTRDYESLKSRLEEVSVLDRTDLSTALRTTIEVVNGEWGSFAPCQVVIVTDGSPGVRHQDAAKRSKQPLCIPFPCQVNVVCIGPESELATASGKQNMERLCETIGVSQADVFSPKGPLDEGSIRGLFTRLVRTCFLPFTAQIKCGHLSTPVSLTPSPHMLQSNFNLSVSADQTYPVFQRQYPNLQYPSEINVCGFLDIGAIPAPPHYSRHFVLDPLELGDSFELGEEKEDSKQSEESQKPSFRVLLHGGLKCESKAALLKLGDNWYGLLFSQTSNSKKSNLVLCVFHPNADIPWLGPFNYLGPQASVASDPRMGYVQQQSPENTFPVTPPHLPSFHTPSNLLWAKETLLQTDVSKVIRYCKKLPEKEAPLVKELNKLRLVSLTFHIPELLELLCVILGKEIASANPTPASKKLLQQCVNFLTTNKSPVERLAINKP